MNVSVKLMLRNQLHLERTMRMAALVLSGSDSMGLNPFQGLDWS